MLAAPACADVTSHLAGDVPQTPGGLQWHGIYVPARCVLVVSLAIMHLVTRVEARLTLRITRHPSLGIGVEQDMKRAKDCFDRAMELGRLYTRTV